MKHILQQCYRVPDLHPQLPVCQAYQILLDFQGPVSIDSDRILKTLNSSPGGGVLPYISLYRYVPPQRVWFLSRFGLKTGIDFANYGLKSRIVFTRAYKHICLFNSK